nr:MAG TPA: hypothetical protein [Caudoviricetes sp.]
MEYLVEKFKIDGVDINVADTESRTQIAHLKQTVDGIVTDISSIEVLQSDVSNLKSKVTTLEGTVSNHTRDINTINKSITELQTKSKLVYKSETKTIEVM